MYQGGAGDRVGTLAEALDFWTVPDLKKLAAEVSSEPKPTRKADLIALIVGALKGDGLQALWKRLDRLQQAAVSEAVHSADGRFLADQFRAKYGESPTWNTGGRYSYDRQPTLLNAFMPGSVIPDDLRARLLEFVPEPARTAVETVDDAPAAHSYTYQLWDTKTGATSTQTEEVPLRRWEMERVAAHDLAAMLRLASVGKITVSDKTFYPTATTTKQITELLQGGDFYAAEDEGNARYGEDIVPIRAFAWPMILQASRLTERAGKKVSLTTGGQKALSAPPSETLKRLWNDWLKTTLMDELRRIDQIKGQTGRGKSGLTAPSRRRAAIVKALADCPMGRWVPINAFLRYIVASGNDFEVTRNPWDLYIAEHYYGNLGDTGNTWPVLQGRYILCFLMEYAATLGLLDIAISHPQGARADHSDLWGADGLSFFSRYDGLLYFRVNPLGAYCLGLAGEYVPAPLEVRAVLRVLPNFEIAVTGTDFSQAEALHLGLYAEKVSDALWRLDRGRLLSAVEEGHGVEALRELLEARSAAALPGTVARLLDEVAERSRGLKEKGTAHLIECADAALALLIANDSRTKPYCFLAGDRHLVVPADSLTAFRRTLRQVGYCLPKASVKG